MQFLAYGIFIYYVLYKKDIIFVSQMQVFFLYWNNNFGILEYIV